MRGPSGQRRCRGAGVGLIGLILWAGLLVFLLLVLDLQIANLASSAGGLESQLYSFVLAENGLEFARSLMQSLEMNQLIAGSDGVFDSGNLSGWRNPISFSRAMDLEVGTDWVPKSDDGLPWDPQTGVRLARMRMSSGEFLIRFSNNPEEEPNRDEDGELIVRSMGIARSLVPSASLSRTELVNQSSLLEARLRHSRYFQAAAPVMLWYSDVEFQGLPELVPHMGPRIGWVGETVDLDGLRIRLRDYLTDPGNEILDLTSDYEANLHRRVMFEAAFWDSFLSKLPVFLDERTKSRILYLSDGGILSGRRKGLIVARGVVTLTSDFRLDGLFLHCGAAPLLMAAGSSVVGAVWKISESKSGPGGKLILEAGTRIERDPAAVAQAMRALPADLIGFRTIFPEMKQ